MSSLLVFLLSVFVLANSDWVNEFDYNLYLDDANTYRLFWTVLNETHIEFGVSAATMGWIGFGISPNGGMPLSDIAFAWFDESDQSIHLQDRHVGVDKITPFVDDQQDLELVDGFTINGVTSFRFIRSITPCDTSDDLPIIDGTTRVIFAWNGDGSDDDSMWHASNIGSKSINILAGIFKEDGIGTSNTAYYDLVVTDYNVPSDDTTYYDTFYTLPATSTKQHIVKFEPIITVGNELHVHHVVLYACLNATSNCGPAVFAWAIGASSYAFPDDIGLEMSTNSGGVRHIKMEIHYDNPDESSSIVDSSGMRIYYTPTLRTYDAGLIEVLLPVDRNQFIVPGLESVRNTAYCTSDCTSASLPNEGVKVISAFLHTHVYGTALNFRHVRNGKELPPIATNRAYDFNYQQMVSTPDEPTVLPGDDLILDCFYDTSDETDIVYGGLSTTEEMCQVYFYVYPKPELALCESEFVQSDINSWASDATNDGYLSQDGDGEFIWTPSAGHGASYDKLWNDVTQRDIDCKDDERQSITGTTGPYTVPSNFVKYEKNDTCSNSTSNQMVQASNVSFTGSPTSSPVSGEDMSSTASTTTKSKVCNLQSDVFTSAGGISVSVFVDVELAEATITMSGPSDVWWGVGFGQTTMMQLYTIVVYESSKDQQSSGLTVGQSGSLIEERRLASFTKGVEITQIISIESDTVDGDERTLVLKRPRLGETFNFPNAAGVVNVLTGYGTPGSAFATTTFMGGHSESGTNAPILKFSTVDCEDVDDDSSANNTPVLMGVFVIAIAHFYAVCFV